MYNEDAIASECIDRVIQQISKLKNKTTLIVVDDGSKDSTSKILKKINKKNKNNLIVISRKTNGGYGAALQTGIQKAIKERFVFYLTMDSDLTNPPEYIPRFINAMSENVDCVKASRYIKGGKTINVPFFRQVISIAGNYLASLFFGVGIKDCTNGFKMVRLELLKDAKFKETNFSIILEEMYYLKKKKARFAEIPNILYSRKSSRSHFKYRPKIFYDYFKYLVKAAFV